MLLSLCTYSVIIKMIDRNLSEVIDPSHYYYYLWDLVIINTIQNILSDKWKIFFWERTNERFWIFRLNINYVLKKEKKRKSYGSYYVTVKVTFFFFFGLSRDFYWRNKLRYRDSILQQNMNIFGKQNHLIWTNQMIKSRGVYQAV